MRKLWLPSFVLLAASACGGPTPPPATPLPTPTAAPAALPPCVITISETELRAKDGAKVLDELVRRIRLPPEDDALRDPKSMADVQKILRRDTLYLFPAAASYARSLNSKEGRQTEATLELLVGESQMLAAQVINLQEAWVASDYRIARATLATEAGPPSSDKLRLLTQLVRVVDDGSAISAALSATAPSHVARGADVVRALKTEAPTDPMTLALIAEFHRLRGEWPEFEAAITAAEAAGEKDKPATRYLRGMEQMERFHRREDAVATMREALKAYPRFVRAQAALVLMANNPRSALRELQKLKAMNQDHYLVMLLEPTLAADHELARIENATGQGGGDGN